MPRLIRTLPSYRKHKASGQAIVTLGGRDHYLGPHGSPASKREYDRLIAEFLSSGRSATFGTPRHELTVVELAAAYLVYAKGYYGTADSSEYKRFLAIVRPLRELYGRCPAAEFGPVQLKALRQRCIEYNWSRSYINTNMRRIVRMFRWAAADGMVPPQVPQALGMVDGLRAGKCEARETTPVLPVADDTVDATLPFMPAVVADMVRLQRLIGCRPAEICLLRPCDLDRQADVWQYRPERHKTLHHGHERVIHFGPKAQAILLRYLARNAQAYCFRPCDSMAKYFAEKHEARKTPLSCGNRPGTNRWRKPGDRYETSSYRRAINRACDKAFPHPTLSKLSRHKLPIAQLAELRRWESAGFSRGGLIPLAFNGSQPD